jgi:flavin-dependent dehydrogenase
MARALSAGHQEDRHQAVAIRGYLDNVEWMHEKIELCVDRSIMPERGYGWIFPVAGRRVNVGLGVARHIYARKGLKLRDMLDRFLAMPEIKEKLGGASELKEVGTGVLNLGSQPNVRRAFDGAVLIGDAASLVDPLDGGGIYNGLISAELAAAVTHRTLSAGDSCGLRLLVYDDLCKKAFGRYFHHHYHLQHLFSLMPFSLDLVVKLFRNNTPPVTRCIERMYARRASLYRKALDIKEERIRMG